jgi:transposase InsO family protein
MIAAEFLRNLIKAVPYKINKVLTDNGIQFTNHHHKNAFTHIFERICNEHHIEHRKTNVKHPWTNGQVERMNRTLKEATVNSFHYASHDELKQHLHAYLMAYKFVKRLKAIKGKLLGNSF